MLTFGYDPLRSCLLEILRAVEGLEYQPILVGGYGLHLKQTHVEGKVRHLLQYLPRSRTTRDLDVMLDLNVVMERELFIKARDALLFLGFEAVDGNKYWQWSKTIELAGSHFDIIVDLLTGPVEDYQDRLNLDSKANPRRVRPKGKSVSFHARTTREAVEFDLVTISVPITGALFDGNAYETQVRIASSFTYLLMKLTAFRDQHNNQVKEHGRHHSLDVYRIIGLMTEDEYKYTRSRIQVLRDSEVVQDVAKIVQDFFANPAGMGVIRLKEHHLFSEELQVDEFRDILCELFLFGKG